MSQAASRRPLFRVALLLLGALLIALPFAGCGKEHAGGLAGWRCPMHPTYTSDQPGSCPICGMTLVPIDPGPATEKPAAPVPGERRILFYRHPMTPTVTSPVPAKDEMGMDYVAVYADSVSGPPSTVSGLAAVEASEAGIRLAGVRTAPAEHDHLSRSSRTVGLVVPDERLVRHVHTKIAGWVEKLYVNYTGQQVRAGEPILAIYSPELLASQEEFLRARESARRFAASSIPEVRRGAEDLVAAARRRLELFDVPASFLATLEQTGRPQRAVTLVAPASGFVTAKVVLEGMEVQPGMELFTLTDLSRVWVEAEFYEYEARFLRVGQRARVILPYDSGHVMPGQVSFIYPTLTPDSRTLKVRLELPNGDASLKPGMYVDLHAELAAGAGVVVPEDAVIETGIRQVVFVETAPGTFEPREVRIGIRGEGRVSLLSGLREGERVATRANFLLDSESKLRAALQAMQSPDAAAPSPARSGAAPEASGHPHEEGSR